MPSLYRKLLRRLPVQSRSRASLVPVLEVLEAHLSAFGTRGVGLSGSERRRIIQSQRNLAHVRQISTDVDSHSCDGPHGLTLKQSHRRGLSSPTTFFPARCSANQPDPLGPFFPTREKKKRKNQSRFASSAARMGSLKDLDPRLALPRSLRSPVAFLYLGHRQVFST